MNLIFWPLDIASGKLSEVTDRASKGVIQGGAKFGNLTNEIWFLTDKDNEFERLAILDVKTKKVNYLTSKINWNVENFSFSEDKKQLVFITNEAGRNKMYLMNTKDQSYSEVKNIPTGLIGGAEFTKDNQSLFFTQSTAQTASDVYRLSLKNGKIEQSDRQANWAKCKHLIWRCQSLLNGKVLMAWAFRDFITQPLQNSQEKDPF